MWNFRKYLKGTSITTLKKLHIHLSKIYYKTLKYHVWCKKSLMIKYFLSIQEYKVFYIFYTLKIDEDKIITHVSRYGINIAPFEIKSVTLNYMHEHFCLQNKIQWDARFWSKCVHSLQRRPDNKATFMSYFFKMGKIYSFFFS